ncbi:uncharacterized protein LOC135277190 [Aotus nancymaae]|uniref:uncharacterized protein LOC135277190 n=1 Tax=Aotus nancymaae TaxID=37293 RepID=UPI0030FEEA51
MEAKMRFREGSSRSRGVTVSRSGGGVVRASGSGGHRWQHSPSEWKQSGPPCEQMLWRGRGQQKRRVKKWQRRPGEQVRQGAEAAVSGSGDRVPASRQRGPSEQEPASKKQWWLPCDGGGGRSSRPHLNPCISTPSLSPSYCLTCLLPCFCIPLSLAVCSLLRPLCLWLVPTPPSCFISASVPPSSSLSPSLHLPLPPPSRISLLALPTTLPLSPLCPPIPVLVSVLFCHWSQVVSFFMINLSLVVIATHFSETKQQQKHYLSSAQWPATLSLATATRSSRMSAISRTRAVPVM